MEKVKDFKVAGLPLPWFIITACVLLVAIYMGVLPQNMVGAFLLMILVGEFLNLVGNHLPIVKTFFGGGPIVVIFGGAALVYFHVLNEDMAAVVNNFMKNPGGFLDFYIAALITGSILGMNRELLIKAAIRYLPVIIAGVACALLLVAGGAMLFGMTPGEGIAYIGIPIMGGGMGAGAVPISKVFANAMHIEAEQILSRLVPAVALGNAMAIVAGGVLKKIGELRPSWTGHGQMLRKGTFEVRDYSKEEMPVTGYMGGIALATGFMTFGTILSKLIGKLTGGALNLHFYAYMIITVAIVKALGIVPEKLERYASGWYEFVAKNWTAALMLGIGISYTDLGQIITAFTPQYVVLCFLVVLGAILGTALFGYAVGFYPIESAITAGLCMANMGGTGDVAVLTAADRMELMPFAQISSRIGGAFIILLATILVPIFF
ncbi:MAG: 2-hydroxycarboxylate transporter family protein [Peptoniphilaceae bacterium]|nr:2-hydroxycarboxylate transporter family protein [Peptoniphilaceae bacterium]MDD7543632.1 2-hydroxycarboxylate transporter family protein [Peptoniphilaceae bacterium]MDY5765545.1 2-hydroxycarboxylate transporter family protein [Peptoniphilaceae bacterium]MDY5841507.1 2-hydroxycarboxylate transporter family protein [Peptoniphilaceae bacterium]